MLVQKILTLNQFTLIIIYIFFKQKFRAFESVSLELKLLLVVVYSITVRES